MSNASCPICKAQTQQPSAADNLQVHINCPRCGQFSLDFNARIALEEEIRLPQFRWAITSHAIRRMLAPGLKPFSVTMPWLCSIWASEKLPNPQMQADTFVEYLGAAEVPPGDWVKCCLQELAGLLGSADDPTSTDTRGLNYVIQHLMTKKGLIERESPTSTDGTWGYRLTFAGWERFEELHRASVDGRVAFMAMQYGDPDMDRVYEQFVRAVEQTSFQLHKLDEKPKAGLIDLRMRVEIRSAKFLIADLTHDNRGAYWEAGFAEGLGKKVYYTCEVSKFEQAKTHFDTEHLLTVKWSPDKMPEALDELKSAIRNDFPTEAKQSDEPTAKP
jgi:hypothetical protein